MPLDVEKFSSVFIPIFEVSLQRKTKKLCGWKFIYDSNPEKYVCQFLLHDEKIELVVVYDNSSDEYIAMGYDYVNMKRVEVSSTQISHEYTEVMKLIASK